jgi:hypothetical protein
MAPALISDRDDIGFGHGNGFDFPSNQYPSNAY